MSNGDREMETDMDSIPKELEGLDLEQHTEASKPEPHDGSGPAHGGKMLNIPKLRSDSISSVTSASSSNGGTPSSRRKRFAIAPVSVGKNQPVYTGSPQQTPRTSPLGHRDEVASYMSQLATKEARVSDIKEQIKSLRQELLMAEQDLDSFRRNGEKLAQQLRNPPRTFQHATTSDLQRGISQRVSRSPSPQRTQVQQRRESSSGMKRVVGEINTQFWSFVEDVRTAALGDAEEEQQAEPQKNTLRKKMSLQSLRDRTNKDRINTVSKENIFYV